MKKGLYFAVAIIVFFICAVLTDYIPSLIPLFVGIAEVVGFVCGFDYAKDKSDTETTEIIKK